MANKAEYRSAIRSRKLIKAAFLEIAAEKEISKITIKELTEKANINRGTFYSHYNDVYDVLEHIEDDIIENLSLFLDNINHETAVERLGDIALPIDCYLNRDVKISRRLLDSRESALFFKKLNKIIRAHLLANERYTSAFKTTAELSICTNFITCGFAGVLQSCMESNEPHAPEDIKRILNRLIENGIHAFTQNE